MSAPVTAEELASVARLDVAHCTGISAGWCSVHGDCTCPRDGTDTREEQSDDCPLHGTVSNHGDDEDEPPQIARSLVLRLARDLADARTEIQAMADMLTEAGIGRHYEGEAVRSRLARMIADANTEGQRTEQAEAERDAIADRNLDLGRELEALRAAVRAHRAAARPAGRHHLQRDLDLWAAAKVTP